MRVRFPWARKRCAVVVVVVVGSERLRSTLHEMCCLTTSYTRVSGRSRAGKEHCVSVNIACKATTI